MAATGLIYRMVTNGEALEMPIKYMQAGMIGMLFCIIDTGLIFCFFINMNTPVQIGRAHV